MQYQIDYIYSQTRLRVWVDAGATSRDDGPNLRIPEAAMNDFTALHAPTIWVTLTYIGLYYAFLAHGLVVKRRVAQQCRDAGQRYDRYRSQHPELLAADRVQLNTLEHMPPFLVLLWGQSLIVSPSSAAILGAMYVAIRATYPFFLGRALHGNFPRRVLFNTFSGYGVLIALAGWQVTTLLA